MAAPASIGFSRPRAANGNAGHVVGKGPEQVALDHPQRPTGESDGVGGGPQVTPDQGEVGSLDGHVGAGTHGQAEIGLGERGGIVDAVTDHRDDPTVGLQPRDDVDLVPRQDFCDHLLDPDLGGDIAGHPPRGRRSATPG